MFLFKQSTWLRCAKFLHRAFHVNVSKETVRKHIKDKCGSRRGDFRRFPPRRNSAAAIDARYDYVNEMESKYSDNTLFNAIYYDEMHLTKNTKTGAWRLIGWIPTAHEETPHENDSVHISLLLAASPDIGLVHYEIVEKSVTGETVLAFFEAMVTKYVTDFPSSVRVSKRAVIADSVAIHHSRCVMDYMNGEVVSMILGFHFLPEYSPFLNPIEEVFGYIKRTIWSARANERNADGDRHFQKRRLDDAIESINSTTMLRQFFEHVQEFVAIAKAKQPVYTHQLYEKSRDGDDVGECPILPADIEALLDSYLPHTYEEFTAEQQALVERQFGVRRLTDSFVEDVINAVDRSDQ
ncbi:hypothetical protein PINS_up022330 [Pythium insidiosum]|nr:hypothetical protein PINS_up012758 [Pythium insidiosum]GLE10261.1 hypothetical protein PINS_up022330 [Pythium insidiosum]